MLLQARPPQIKCLNSIGVCESFLRIAIQFGDQAKSVITVTARYLELRQWHFHFGGRNSHRIDAQQCLIQSRKRSCFEVNPCGINVIGRKANDAYARFFKRLGRERVSERQRYTPALLSRPTQKDAHSIQSTAGRRCAPIAVVAKDRAMPQFLTCHRMYNAQPLLVMSTLPWAHGQLPRCRLYLLVFRRTGMTVAGCSTISTSGRLNAESRSFHAGA